MENGNIVVAACDWFNSVNADQLGTEYVDIHRFRGAYRFNECNLDILTGKIDNERQIERKSKRETERYI